MYERILQNEDQKYNVESWQIITIFLFNTNYHELKTYQYKSQQKKL